MAKPVSKDKQAKADRPKPVQFAPDFFTGTNRIIVGIGMVLVVLGFYTLAAPEWLVGAGETRVNSFVSMYVAPVLLVVGFLVVIPIGILYKKKDPETEQGD